MIQLPSLSLPSPPIRVKEEQGKTWVFDIIRKKWVILTPEEWVRQSLIHFLLGYGDYPASLIMVEKQIKVGSFKKRIDICILLQSGLPGLIVECKSPDILLTESTLLQIGNYNQVIGAKLALVTNGMQFMLLNSSGSIHSIQVQDLPKYGEL